MRIFLAGAGGVIGRRLTPLLRAAGYDVVGTTRTADKTAAVAALGAEPVVVDVFDAAALTRALQTAAPHVVMHQLTDLAFAPGTPGYEAGLERNARLRIEGTRNLVGAAKAAGVRRLIAQSIAFVYAPGDGARVETDPLDLAAAGGRKRTVDGVVALEDATRKCRKASCCATAYCTARAPGSSWRSAANRPCMSMPRLMLRYSPLARASPASTISPKMTARFQARRPSASLASMRSFAFRNSSSFRDASEASGPGIQTPQCCGLWIPGSGASCLPRNDS